jgi:hypothetical protein
LKKPMGKSGDIPYCLALLDDCPTQKASFAFAAKSPDTGVSLYL